MLRSALWLSGAVALAALVAPIAPAAAPAPGIAYDEIVRIVAGGTPPPPGNFQNDAAALTTAAAATPAPTPAPQRRGINIGSIANAVLNRNPGAVAGAVADNVVANATDRAIQNALGKQFAVLNASLQSFLQPHLLRYAYYNGWERIDDLIDQTATIRKCDMGEVYRLDLAHKTYSVYDPNSEPIAAPPPATRAATPVTVSTPAPPGTAVAVITSATKTLGPLRIENQPTNGYSQTMSFATTQSTGSCRDASASVTMQQYISGIDQPAVAFCPARRAPVPESPADLAAPPQPAGGCRPTLELHNSGSPIPTGKLALYTLMTMNASGGATPAPSSSAAPGIGFLTERGNLKTLGATDAALFSVPSDFTRVTK